MDVREKLFTLFQDCNNPSWKWFPNNAEMLKLIDYLIAHGVTVQEWIPVTERLPNHWEDVLVRLQCGDCVVAVRSGLIWRVRWNNTLLDREPTQWMPLPEPPKGE